MLNQIVIMGRMSKDIELRHTQSGIPVATFSVACDRDIKDRETGDRKTDWFTVTAWRGTAELAARYLRKGDLAIISGRLDIREWTDKDGAKRSTPQIVASSIYFTGGKRESSSDAPSEQTYSAPEFEELGDADQDLPF